VEITDLNDSILMEAVRESRDAYPDAGKFHTFEVESPPQSILTHVYPQFLYIMKITANLARQPADSINPQ
jgi:hypothetical protein